MTKFTKKEVFYGVEDATTRNKGRAQFLYNLLEDATRKSVGKEVKLTYGALNQPENRHLFVAYIAHIPVEDRKDVFDSFMSILKGSYV